jgi:hypothetical protein
VPFFIAASISSRNLEVADLPSFFAMGKSGSLKAVSFSITILVNETMVVGFADDNRGAALDQPGEATAVSGFSSLDGPEARCSAGMPEIIRLGDAAVSRKVQAREG